MHDGLRVAGRSSRDAEWWAPPFDLHHASFDLRRRKERRFGEDLMDIAPGSQHKTDIATRPFLPRHVYRCALTLSHSQTPLPSSPPYLAPHYSSHRNLSSVSLMKTHTPLPYTHISSTSLPPHPRSSGRTKSRWRWSGCFRRIRRGRWRASTSRSETRPGVPTSWEMRATLNCQSHRECRPTAVVSRAGGRVCVKRVFECVFQHPMVLLQVETGQENTHQDTIIAADLQTV